MRVLIVLVIALLATTANADTFKLALDIRQARSLYDAGRFRDASAAFANAYEELNPEQANHLDVYLVVTDYLARSLSQQGLTERVSQLMRERHNLIANHYDIDGYLYASSLARLAESLYREGDRDTAITLTRDAIAIYGKLSPVPEEEMKLAKTNIVQYRITPFSLSMLPMDLSDFYTRCKVLGESINPADADILMSQYVEVGVDFIPAGKWQEFFNAVKYPSAESFTNGAERRVYIPHESETMRDEICSVSIKAGRIVSVESVRD